MRVIFIGKGVLKMGFLKNGGFISNREFYMSFNRKMGVLLVKWVFCL
jgi:hypothetical protein